jgi:predicted amidohydrolase
MGMLKVAQIQFNPQVGETEHNFRKVSSYLQETKGAGLVILPELANSGYNFINRDHAFSLAEEVNKSSYVEMLQHTAKENNQFIVSGYHEKDREKLFNTSLLFSPEGHIGKYRKIHLFMNEKDIFSRGNIGLPVFDIDGYVLGMLICFDYLFPEIWRIMGLKGADLIAHPSNLVTYKAYKVVPAQSVINRFFIFTTNRIGRERDISFSGSSFVTDPEGEVIAEASKTDEEVLVTEVNPDLSRDKMITERNHVLLDRFPDLYGAVVKQSIAENE